MSNHGTKLPPASDPDSEERLARLKAFWIALQMSGDAGCTTWEVLDGLSNSVTARLMERPPDIVRAEGLTAQAMMLLVGQSED